MGTVLEVNKSTKSEREIQSLLSFAEKTVKAIDKKGKSDYALMMEDANRFREFGSHPLEKCVGKVIVRLFCKPETLSKLVQSNIRPHTILQIEAW